MQENFLLYIISIVKRLIPTLNLVLLVPKLLHPCLRDITMILGQCAKYNLEHLLVWSQVGTTLTW